MPLPQFQSDPKTLHHNVLFKFPHIYQIWLGGIFFQRFDKYAWWNKQKFEKQSWNNPKQKEEEIPEIILIFIECYNRISRLKKKYYDPMNSKDFFSNAFGLNFVQVNINSHHLSDTHTLQKSQRTKEPNKFCMSTLECGELYVYVRLWCVTYVY